MAQHRIGIIGLTEIACGRSSTPPPLYLPMPCSHAEAFAARADCTVTAACDLRPEALEQFRAEWGRVWPEVRCYRDASELLREDPPELLSVCTSDNAHAAMVVAACEAGVRAIFCEKPIATTLADADRMIAAAEASGTILSIDHTRRWRANYVHARELIRQGEIGGVQRILGWLGGPRSMLFRNGTHLIDTVLLLTNDEPEWVFAELDAGFEEYFEYQGDGGRDPAGDPGGSLYLHLRSGARALLSISKNTPPGFGLELFGERGRLRVSDTELVLCVDGAERRVPVPPYRLVDIPAGIDELVRKLNGEPVELSCPPATARAVLRILLGALKSQERGNARVNLADIMA